MKHKGLLCHMFLLALLDLDCAQHTLSHSIHVTLTDRQKHCIVSFSLSVYVIAWETDHTSWHHHWFPLKWCLRNNHRNSILMTCHYPDLDSASDWMKQFFNQSEALPGSGWWCIVSVEFLLSFLRHHFVGKPMVESWIVGCFLRPLSVENRRLCSQGAVTQHKLQQHLAFTFSVAFITSLLW